MCDKTAGDDTNLQHFATLFSTMQYFITIYNISPHSATFRIILQHFVTFATILNIFARCYISQNFASFRQVTDTSLETRIRRQELFEAAAVLVTKIFI